MLTFDLEFEGFLIELEDLKWFIQEKVSLSKLLRQLSVLILELIQVFI